MPRKPMAFAFVALLFAGAPAARSAAPPARLRLLDGGPITVVCVTNSHAGGRQLDAKIKRYLGGKSPVTVRFTSGWSTPVDPRTGKVQAGSWLDRFSLQKEKKLGHPVVVIALSGVGPCRGRRRRAARRRRAMRR
jgi:hypothetical protein